MKSYLKLPHPSVRGDEIKDKTKPSFSFMSSNLIEISKNILFWKNDKNFDHVFKINEIGRPFLEYSLSGCALLYTGGGNRAWIGGGEIWWRLKWILLRQADDALDDKKLGIFQQHWNIAQNHLSFNHQGKLLLFLKLPFFFSIKS